MTCRARRRTYAPSKHQVCDLHVAIGADDSSQFLIEGGDSVALDLHDPPLPRWTRDIGLYATSRG
jgi:hypothetical protein